MKNKEGITLRHEAGPLAGAHSVPPPSREELRDVTH